MPMSSPQITRMLGLLGFAIAVSFHIAYSAFSFALLESEDLLPVALHVDNSPAFRLRFVPRLVERTDLRFAVVRPFALGVGVMDDQREARPGRGGRPFAASRDRRPSSRTRRAVAGRCASECRQAFPPCHREDRAAAASCGIAILAHLCAWRVIHLPPPRTWCVSI